MAPDGYRKADLGSYGGKPDYLCIGVSGQMLCLESFCLLQQRQHALRNLVGLGHHGSASLFAGSRVREVSRFHRKVSIRMHKRERTGSLRVMLRLRNAGFKARLQSTEVGALAADEGQGRVYGFERLVAFSKVVTSRSATFCRVEPPLLKGLPGTVNVTVNDLSSPA